VKKDTPIDTHALINTTSVYTSARIFPMLPERLCTDLTSLNPAEDRLALVTEMVFNADASLAGSTVYRARVRNRAKLAYDAVSAWIDGAGDLPDAAAAVPAWRPSCAPRTRWRSSCAHAAMPWARWTWRPSSRGRCSRASKSWTSASRCRTARAS
jgi:exoribonuclease R